MDSTCWVSELLWSECCASDEFSVGRRPSQGLHQEDHVAAEPVDARRQNLKARRGDYEQRKWRDHRAMAVQCGNLQQVLKDKVDPKNG